MTEKELIFLQVWVEGEQQALEWLTSDGRTYQICGIRGATGLFERFFHKDSHTTRRNAGSAEVLDALQKVSGTLELYRGTKGSGKFFTTPSDAVEAAKEWCGATA